MRQRNETLMKKKSAVYILINRGYARAAKKREHRPRAGKPILCNKLRSRAPRIEILCDSRLQVSPLYGPGSGSFSLSRLVYRRGSSYCARIVSTRFRSLRSRGNLLCSNLNWESILRAGVAGVGGSFTVALSHLDELPVTIEEERKCRAGLVKSELRMRGHEFTAERERVHVV